MARNLRLAKLNSRCLSAGSQQQAAPLYGNYVLIQGNVPR
jgi:hypothetical protein